jgi:cytoskeletal protein RodZ
MLQVLLVGPPPKGPGKFCPLTQAGSAPVNHKQASNHSLVASAVIGPVFVILAIILALFLIRKRRKNQENKKTSKEINNDDEQQDKAQLHADSLLPPQELHGDGFSGHELPSAHRNELAVPKPTGTELSALEPTGTELAAIEPTGSEMSVLEPIGTELPVLEAV